MFISPVGIAQSLQSKKISAKRSQASQSLNNTSFKSANYKAAFAKYYNSSVYSTSNAKVFSELMRAAQNARGAVVDDIAKVFMKPDEYSTIMNGFRSKGPVYKDLNDASYHKPLWLVRKAGETLSSVVNFGTQGGFFDVITGNAKQDTRICFHGIDQYANKIICLGKDVNGNDIRIYSDSGIGTIIAAEMVKKL